MNVYWVWLIVPAYFLLAWVATTWIRARYGLENSAIDEKVFASSGATRRMSAALDLRDRKIATLEDRVRVLERIATDRESALREEFERLRA